MTQSNYEAAYLETVKDTRIYQDDVAEAAKVIVRRCAQALQATRVGLWLLSDEGNDMSCMTSYDLTLDDFDSGAVISEEAFPKYFEALLHARVVDAADAFSDPRTSELTESYLKVLDVRSLLDATIRNVKNGELNGILCAEMVAVRREWTGEERMFVASMSDLLAQRLITSEWIRSERRFQAIYEGTSEGVMVFDGEAFNTLNPAALRMFGAEENDLIGRTPVAVSPELQPDGQPSAAKARAYVERTLAGEPQNFEWRHRRLDGSEFDAEITLNSVKFGGKDTLFALMRDVTSKKNAERKAFIAQQELEHRATHDSLTGLPNREQLHRHVSELIGQIQHPDQEVALLLFDLNRFKEINDTLGHATGDKVLVALTRVVQPKVLQMGGSLFRLGGDEFVAVFDSAETTVNFDRLFDVIAESFAFPIKIDGVSFEMSASIGAAVYPESGRDSHELLRCADVAMYHGKTLDGASPWYSPEADPTDPRRLSMLGELRQGIRNDELVLHYQPRIDIKTGELTGCEALVRWQHPERGLLPPFDFLVPAERTELIHPLTEWVVNAAFDEISRFCSLNYSIPVAINLSARNLPDAQLFDLIEERLSEDDICPRSLGIEITESALISNPTRSLQNLKRLEKLGVSIAIDDFGTGYSSLSLLKQLPLDTLKIDRSFVNDMLDSASDRVIVSSTINLAHNFSARVVAEGVENQATLDALAALNCDEAQGYYIARPMPIEQFHEWVYERSARSLAA